MRKLWPLGAFAALTLVALALAACSRPEAYNAPASAQTNGGPSPNAPSVKLAQIFTPDIVGANVAWLESLTGPAFSTNGDDSVYKIDGCELIVGEDKGKIDNIGVQGYSPHCSFHIAQYFAHGAGPPAPDTPTFGDLKKTLGGDFRADCLTTCGNAADPIVSLSYEGSHADQFNGLLAQVSLTTDPATKAADDWAQKLTAKYGAAYVTAGKFNAGDNLADVATADFAALTPETIRVGQNLKAPVKQ